MGTASVTRPPLCLDPDDHDMASGDLRGIIAELAAADGPPTLDARQTALIQVALAVAGECALCIADAVTAALESGAGRAEIVEAGSLAVRRHAGTVLLGLNPLLEALAAAGA